jgi:hypothetical protein
VLAPVAAVVAPVRAPVVTVLYDCRRADDRGGSRDRSAAEYCPPANASSAQRHVKLLPCRFALPPVVRSRQSIDESKGLRITRSG